MVVVLRPIYNKLKFSCGLYSVILSKINKQMTYIFLFFIFLRPLSTSQSSKAIWIYFIIIIILKIKLLNLFNFICALWYLNEWIILIQNSSRLIPIISQNMYHDWSESRQTRVTISPSTYSLLWKSLKKEVQTDTYYLWHIFLSYETERNS